MPPVNGEALRPPFVAAYRLKFRVDEPRVVRIHVSADERYELFLDGERVGSGPERGDPLHWPFESYDLSFAAGEHLLVARVWSLGRERSLAPEAQMSVRPGFILAAEGEARDRFNTGFAAWEAKVLSGYGWIEPPPGPSSYAGGFERIDGRAFDWGFLDADARGYTPCVTVDDAADAGVTTGFAFNDAGRAGGAPYGMVGLRPRLIPARLPPMLDMPARTGTARFAAFTAFDPAAPLDVRRHDASLAANVQAMLDADRPLVIPSHTTALIVIDLDRYACAYPELVASGGRDAEVWLEWAEAFHTRLGHTVWEKPHRDVIEGGYFNGKGDRFVLDGGAKRTYAPLWWRAGRYLRLVVQTRGEPAAIDALRLRETRYPLEIESDFACDDATLQAVTPLMLRSLEMCCHDTFLDCPHYEQLMYAGDTRLDALAMLTLTTDDRLPRRAIELFDWSRSGDGLTLARYPGRDAMAIPPFALAWVGMVHDHALWRGDRGFVRERLAGVRAVLEAFRRCDDGRQPVRGPEGWYFVDWVPEPAWREGIPPGGQLRAVGPVYWQLLTAVRMKAELERWAGEAALAERDEAWLATLVERAAVFWDEGRGLYADDLEHRHFSEHAQCLALLSGLLSRERAARLTAGLFDAPGAGLTRTTLSFSHFYLDACRVAGRMDRFFERLDEQWGGLPSLGLKTVPEMPEPTRSDCHGWGAHPLYHRFRAILGIEPVGFGFQKVRIRPQLGSLSFARGVMVHPNGEIRVDLRRERTKLIGSVDLPANLSGVLEAEGQLFPIAAGRFELSATTSS